ncbi:MAG TPA: LTA synthase family protein [Rhodanobacteraceae bacterium]|jgi:phosphoglycerol transferase MdoB-like AlkP superfamily enzyme|nr:LTA synthase family protein [Rhodanobacteraceae bacterium]
MAPASPSRTGRYSPGARVALLVLLAIAFVLCTAWLDGGKGIVPPTLWTHPAWLPWWDTPLRMFCNALPALLLAFVLFAWTRRAGWSFLLAFALQAVLYGVNALKVQNLGAPLMPADFRMLGQLGKGGGDLLSGYLPHIALLVVGLLACIAVLVAWFRFEPPMLEKRPRIPRFAVSAVLLAALVTLVVGVPFWRGLYNAKLLGLQPWSPTATREHNGLVESLLLFHLQYGAAHDKPDVAAALQLMARFEPRIEALAKSTAAAAPPRKPDIVVILSESFFDPTILNGYDKDVDFMPNLRRLAQHGTSGWMHSPTFGGGTIRTEFEVLTGLPLRYFSDVMFPYLQLHQKVIPGIVRLLEQHGYQTVAVHGGDPHFWNRASAFKALGFDRFISEGDFPANDAVHDGKYMSDKSFTDEMLRQLKPDGPPQFMLGISIEAHGPYDQTYGIDTRERDAIPVPPKVTGEAKKELQNYIYHMRHADQQLGRFADTLAKRDRPTLIVFFGDHLPAIVPAFQQAGFHDGKGFLVQTVPYLVIDTSQLHTARPVTKDVAAWELPGMVLHRAGIHDPWFALTQLVAPQLEGLTRAPDAPVAPETPEQKQLDKGMSNVAELRLEGKLEALWPKAAAMAAQPQPSSTASTGARSPGP